jgi:hypothetical protein
LGARRCPPCDFLFEIERRPPVVVLGDLEIADSAAILRFRVQRMPRLRQRLWAGADYERLKLVAEIRGYREGWAFSSAGARSMRRVSNERNTGNQFALGASAYSDFPSAG